MTPTALADLDKRFKYESDGFDSWSVLDNKTGPLKGDCDDYAVTALWLLCGRSMSKFWKALKDGKAAIWYVRHKEKGSSHLMLHVEGLGWFDNTRRGKGPQPDTGPYVKRFRARVPLIYIKMRLGKFA